MSKILFVLLVSVFVVWSLLGLQWFLRIEKWIKNKYKYCIFILVCGPLIWLFGLFIGTIHIIDIIVVDKVFDKLEKWFINE